MKLTFTTEAISKINALKTTNDQLVLDLDDGIGPFSSLLMENGLKYRLLIVPAELVPANFDGTLTSNAGSIRFNADTGRYLDSTMQVNLNARLGTFQLSGNSGLLEPNLPIAKALPSTDVSMH